jgi:hypothetical protein
MPRRPGERIKTDRRDAMNLAKSHRAGEMTPVLVPDEAHEGIRDLVQARLAARATRMISGVPIADGDEQPFTDHRGDLDTNSSAHAPGSHATPRPSDLIH